MAALAGVSRPISRAVLLAALGAALLAGCGGGSRSDSPAKEASAESVTQSTDDAATSSTSATPSKTTAAPSDRSSGNATASTPSSAPNAYDGVPFAVHTASMTPTYQPETTVYYDPTGNRPQIGDVIIFFLARGASEGECGTPEVGGAPCRIPHSGLTKTLAMKRVVGLPGDTIAIHRGRVIRNGRPESEPKTVACGDEPGCEFTKAIVVPPGHYYVMSDDRQLYQEDSRVYGAISQAAIVGTVLGS